MIIDFHTHAFNPKIAERAISKLEHISGFTPFTRGLVPQLIDRMDEWGVDKSVMLSIATKPSQQTIINDWAAAVNNAQERIIAFGSVHPDADDFEDEIARIKQLGLHGIKLHPDYQDFMVDDKKLDPLYEAAACIGLPIIFHAGRDCMSPNLIHCTPERAAKVIKRHPKLKIILAHLGGCDMWEQVFDIIAGTGEQVYLDTSFTLGCPDELMLKIIRKHGTDRILFGSDCPWASGGAILEKLLRLDLTDDEREKIFGKNAVGLLGLFV